MLLKKLRRLKQYEKSMRIANEMLELQGRDGNYNYDKVFGLQKEYTLEDYFNKKKNCESFNLFNYCPYCGEKIELKESGE